MLLVVPGFALVYLVAAPTTFGKRVAHLLAAGAAMAVAGGWWIAIVQLVPAAHRPYIGGSQTNSVWELIWGYNGLGRLNGQETGSVTKTPGSGWGPTGVLRMFTDQIGGQVSWLLPAALTGLALGLVLTRRSPRTDRLRAALLLWGSWLVVTGLTFSLMAGIFHPYYTVALAPAIGALSGDRGHAAPGATERALGPIPRRGRRRRHGRLGVGPPRPLPPLAALPAVGDPRRGSAGRRRHAGTPPSRPPLHHRGADRCVRGTARRTGRLRHPHRIRPAHRRHSQRRAHALDARAARAARTDGATSARCPARCPADRTGWPVRGSARAEHEEHGHADPPVAALGCRRGAAGPRCVVLHLGRGDGGRRAGSRLPARERPPGPGVGRVQRQRPVPSPAQFRADVAAHRLHWFVGGTDLAPSTTGSDQAHEIAAWVESHYVPTIVDGVTLYDLTPPLR